MMNKKVLRIVLMTSLSLILMFSLAACGGDSDSGSETSKSQTDSAENKDNTKKPDSTTEATENNDSAFPAALKDVEVGQIPDIDLTGWNLSGGIIDGVEMEQADLESTLEACGGTFQFIFMQDKAVQMVNGEKSFDGTYEIVEDNYAIYAKFTGYEYYGVFSTVNDQTVLIIANTKVPETALYFTQIDEH